MKIVSSLALMVAAGCISVAVATPQQIDAVPLNATTYNAGHIAQAVLTPLNTGETELSLFVGGVPDSTLVPAHLYTYVYSGSCARHEPKPAYSLNQVVTDNFNETEGIQLQKTVPLPYETLRSGHYSLVVRDSPADGNHDIFCGELI
ncbi:MULTISPECIES: hypothetical protein [Pseudomonas]|jgi:hypothetical protein|uniref:hypothetical protein n=1 Tax=Pseudomonas TaxID=286 RepID=UPI0005FBC0A9|nr:MULTISPECIES: hypothetical protein [Pseudomonas]KJZ36914.1 hypothetical protein VC33_13965 [Pseudomonas fluorescens]PWK39592.1 hypothetical protein C7534_1125 [Pseudomonas sp. OV226]